MKMWSDKLSLQDIAEAFSIARREHGADIECGPVRHWIGRDGRTGYEFHAGSLHGNRNANSGTYGAGLERSASWDAWGWVIAELYRRDPSARIAQYQNAGDFVLQVLHAKAAGRKEPADFLELVGSDTTWKYGGRYIAQTTDADRAEFTRKVMAASRRTPADSAAMAQVARDFTAGRR